MNSKKTSTFLSWNESLQRQYHSIFNVLMNGWVRVTFAYNPMVAYTSHWCHLVSTSTQGTLLLALQYHQSHDACPNSASTRSKWSTPKQIAQKEAGSRTYRPARIQQSWWATPHALTPLEHVVPTEIITRQRCISALCIYSLIIIMEVYGL